MGNCLKTQLKENVNNDNLEGLESLNFTVIAIENPGSYDYLFKATGGTIVTPQEYPMTGDNLANGNYKVIVNNKYSVTNITVADACVLSSGGIEKFAYMTELTALLYVNNGSGYESRKFGNIESLGNLIKLEIFYVGGTVISGDLDVLAKSQVLSGRNSGTLEVSTNYILECNGEKTNNERRWIKFGTNLPSGAIVTGDGYAIYSSNPNA